MAGWIKLHRKILDNPIFLKPELYQLFSYCLLRANHSEKKIIWNGAEETMEKGCFITGRKVIAQELKQNESSVYRHLKTLERLNMISLKSNNKFSIVKVLNYCIYQGEDMETEQQLNNQRTTTEQPANTDKNDKNVKNDKKDYISIPDMDYVKLTQKQYDNIVSKYGKVETDRKIFDLNVWKGAKGGKSKDDNLTLQNWLRRDKEKEQQKPTFSKKVIR